MTTEPDILEEEDEPILAEEPRPLPQPVYWYTLEEWLRRSGMRVH